MNNLDSSLERAALWKNIIPSLRDHCREKHDMEFQVRRFIALPVE